MGLLSRASAAAGLRSAGAPPIWDDLAGFSKKHPGFQGIVLAPPGNPGERPEDFSGQVLAMVRTFGTVLPLASGGALILLDRSQDRELISHRLTNTLGARALLNFAAEDPRDAYKLLRPYL
jgi:hypothetical protein